MEYSKYIDKWPLFDWQLKPGIYSDGKLKNISWIIQTKKLKVTQTRGHTEKYKNKITKIQSKYGALYVSLFWGIGIFNIYKKWGCHKNR